MSWQAGAGCFPQSSTTESIRIESSYEVVVDAAQLKVPKPSPEVFEITLKKLSLEPTACWIIEDSINGLIAAKQAGCFAVGITTSFPSYTLRNAGADLVVESFAQLHSHLAGA
ncbi:MAG: HAD family phosphatase [Silvibacterium sp.]